MASPSGSRMLFISIALFVIAGCSGDSFESAESHFLHGRFETAAEEFSRIDDPVASLYEARSLYMARKWSEAGTRLDLLLQSHGPAPTLEQAAVLRAYCSYALNDFRDAASRLEKLESDGISDPKAGADLANLKKSLLEKRGELFYADRLIRAGEFRSAAKVAREAISYADNSPLRFELLAAWAKARALGEEPFTEEENLFVRRTVSSGDSIPVFALRRLDEIAQSLARKESNSTAMFVWEVLEQAAGEWRSIEPDTADRDDFQAWGIVPKKNLAYLYRKSYGYRSLIGRARAAMNQGDEVTAEDFYERILTYPRQGEDQYHAPEARLGLARLYLKRGRDRAGREVLGGDRQYFSASQAREAERLLAGMEQER